MDDGQKVGEFGLSNERDPQPGNQHVRATGSETGGVTNGPFVSAGALHDDL